MGSLGSFHPSNQSSSTSRPTPALEQIAPVYLAFPGQCRIIPFRPIRPRTLGANHVPTDKIRPQSPRPSPPSAPTRRKQWRESENDHEVRYGILRTGVTAGVGLITTSKSCPKAERDAATAENLKKEFDRSSLPSILKRLAESFGGEDNEAKGPEETPRGLRRRSRARRFYCNLRPRRQSRRHPESKNTKILAKIAKTENEEGGEGKWTRVKNREEVDAWIKTAIARSRNVPSSASKAVVPGATSLTEPMHPPNRRWGKNPDQALEKKPITESTSEGRRSDIQSERKSTVFVCEQGLTLELSAKRLGNDQETSLEPGKQRRTTPRRRFTTSRELLGVSADFFMEDGKRRRKMSNRSTPAFFSHT